MARLGIRFRVIVIKRSISGRAESPQRSAAGIEYASVELRSCAALVLAIGIATVADGTRNAEIANAIKNRVDAKKSAGMVVATIEPDGSSSMAAFGNPGPDAKPLDGDSVFEIGSITKVFTAILLADMADRGEVTLDDPVARHLRAGVRVPERNGKAITLLDLSTQTSGLPRLPDNMKPANPLNPYADYSVDRVLNKKRKGRITPALHS